MTKNFNIPFSVLDLAPIVEGGSASLALANSLDLARHAERLGYQRFWLAEHHNFSGIASAATAVVIAHIAAGTSTIRLGAGGVMLPNHAPLVIAEQFGTLESLHPGRIDLGLGRAPGTDPMTTRALRRERSESVDSFPADLRELLAYFQPAKPGQKVRAIPGAGLNVPVWILGSSLFSAGLAASLGLPYVFASHFAPDELYRALDMYRREFQPSEFHARPYAMACVNVFAADTDAEAARLFTTLQRQFVDLQRGSPGPIKPSVDTMDGHWSPMEAAWTGRALRESIVGSAKTVRRDLVAFLEGTGINELMVTASIFDHAARIRSFEIVADLW